MDDDVVDDFVRGEQQAGGEVDVAFGRTTAPVGEIVFEADRLNGLLEIFIVELMDRRVISGRKSCTTIRLE